MNSLWIFFVQRVDGQKLWKREGETLCVHYTAPGVQWRAKWSRWTSTSDNNKSLYIPFLPYYLIILYILYMYIFFCIESRASARTNKENAQKKRWTRKTHQKKITYSVEHEWNCVNFEFIHCPSFLFFVCHSSLFLSFFFCVCFPLKFTHWALCL